MFEVCREDKTCAYSKTARSRVVSDKWVEPTVPRRGNYSRPESSVACRTEGKWGRERRMCDSAAGSFTVLLIHLPWVEMLHNNKISPEVCLEATPSWSWGEKAHFIIIYCQRIKFGWQRNLSLSFTCCMWTAPHVGIDLKGFIGIYSRHCSTSKLLTVLFCLTYTLERLSPGVPTFKHPPLTWIGAVVLSHEVMDL